MKFLLNVFPMMMLTLLSLVALGDCRADEPKERVFSNDFEDQDLSGKSFKKKNLDNSNFRNADLSETNFEGASLKNCCFEGARLKNTVLSYADLTGSDFREATLQSPSIYQTIMNNVNLSDLDLSTVQLNEKKLRGANLRNARGLSWIYDADFFGADVRGTDFTQAIDFKPASFRKAKFDQFTRWHEGFDPKERGADYVQTDSAADADTKPPEKKKMESTDKPMPKPDSAKREAAFLKLDGNMDGVLSGKEMATCKERDADEDGEVTLEEYLSHKSGA